MYVNLLFLVLSLLFSGNSSTYKRKQQEKLYDRTINPGKEEYDLVWSDEFNIPGKPDSTNWKYESGFVRNRELQWYQPQNATCKEGKLVITARRESIQNPFFQSNSNDWRKERAFANYTSACVITKGFQEFEAGGYYEIKAKIDTSLGAWPAIWLLGTEGEWPHNGEIDIMEFYRKNKVSSLLANACWGTEKRWEGAWDSAIVPLSDFTQKDANWAQQFHTWKMWWDEKTISIYLDDTLMNTIELNQTTNPDGSNPFTGNKKFYLLLNLAIGSNGGDPSSTQFPITFEVDYVRVYKELKNEGYK